MGSKWGANGPRERATPGNVRRLKLLVEPHAATLRNDKNSYGMQEVRGSNPLSSILRSSRFSGDHFHVWV
jgi:hypothetical protein